MYHKDYYSRRDNVCRITEIFIGYFNEYSNIVYLRPILKVTTKI